MDVLLTKIQNVVLPWSDGDPSIRPLAIRRGAFGELNFGPAGLKQSLTYMILIILT